MLRGFGALELTRQGTTILPGRRKLLLLLAYLARQEGKALPRAYLASLFWPGSDEARSRQSLRQALAELRVAVGDGLTISDVEVRLVPGAVALDANAFVELMNRGELARAFDRWAGEFLPDAEAVGEEELRAWLEAERQDLRGRLAWVGEALVLDAQTRAAWREGAEIAERWSGALPHDQRAARRTVEMLLLSGRPAEAAARHAAFAHRLREDLGIEPEAEFLRLGATLAARGSATARSSVSPGSVALFSADLVGREAEFATLMRAWAEVSRGEPGVALIEGEEGIGKSRLLEETIGWIQHESPKSVVLRSRAFEAEQDRPGVLLRHLLAPLATAPGLAALPPPALRAVATLVPEIADRFPTSGMAAEGPMGALEAIARALTEVAAEHPLVVAVDDAHFADAQSRELIEGLCRRPIPGLLLILTASPGRLLIADLVRRSGSGSGLVGMRLESLDGRDVDRLLGSMAEFRPDDRTGLARRLMMETGGNPLAVIELVTGLADQGAIALGNSGLWELRATFDGAPLPVPSSIRESTARRLTMLPRDLVAVLEAAAVLGRDSETALLQTLTTFDSERLEAALDKLAAGRMLRPARDGSSRFEFANEIVRRAMYEQLSPRRRGELHRRASRSLEARPSTDSARIDALEYHRSKSSSRRASVWRLVGVGGLVLATIAGVVIVARQRGAAEGVRSILVTPVVVTGENPPRELDAAAADLFVAMLESGGLDAPVATRAPGDLDSAGNGERMVTFERQASNRGARLILNASVHAQPDGRLEVRAMLREANRSNAIISESRADGGVEELPLLVGNATRALLANRFDIPEAPFRLKAARTRSVAALRLYLQGERLARRSEMESAARAYWEATRLDPDFALAWHALGLVNAWFWLGDRARVFADSAFRNAGRLQIPEVRTLEGWQLLAHGEADDAERRFGAILGFAREGAEANIGMGEVLYHHNWSRGRDIAEARPYWEAAFRADSGDWRIAAHLWELAARTGHPTDAAHYLRHDISLSTDTVPSTFQQVMLAVATGDTATATIRLSDLGKVSEWELTEMARSLVIMFDRPDLAEAPATELTKRNHTPEVRAFGYQLLSDLAMARGRWREALAINARAAGLEPVSAATHEALLWVTPFLPPAIAGDSARRTARERLARAPLHQVRRTFLFWFDGDRSREQLIRPYLGTLLSRVSRAAGPEAIEAGPKARIPDLPDSILVIQPLLQRSLDAWDALGRADSAGASATLDDSWNGIEATQSVLSVFFCRPWDLYLKATLLENRGQWEEAAAWFGGVGTLSIADYAYAAPAALHRGRIAERQGKAPEARAAYRRVLRLWQDADPEFQPMVEEARARLAALGS
jgi:DNA-binding SARP family transcriptional activator/tetratricopeptide (TPR) repeat protein